MKKVLITFMLLSCIVAQSQVTDPSFDPTAEITRMVSAPNSPEAQAFIKYGNTPVNMYTGNPNLKIPIYTYKGRELDLPISLTYDASGIKVEQLATSVGLGWNLNVGGRISRIINGFPDDFHLNSYTSYPYKSFWDTAVKDGILAYDDLPTSPSFSTQQLLENYLYFIKKANENEYDIQPDFFSFNALGNSDTFTIDVSSKYAKSLDSPRLDITFTKAYGGAGTPITKWVVTTDDGTKYTFEEEERTRDVNLNDVGPMSLYGLRKEYNSSWLLTKIESTNGKDVYDFTYTDLGFWTNNRTASTLIGVTNALNCQNNNPSPTNPMGFNGNVLYTIQQKVISEIKHNNKRIVAFDLLAKRWDMDVNSAIEKIHIYNDDTSNHAADLYKSFVFSYDYFRTSTTPAAPYSSGNVPNKNEVRLKLDAIEIKDKTESLVKNYSFEYNSPYSLASTTSNSQDYYGYYNGASNSVMYPKYTLTTCVPSNDGANRDPSFSFAKRGLISKITYPTKGHTEFEYEANYEKSGTTYNLKAGVRVKWIKDYTDATTLATHKSYTYPSGTVISNPILTYISDQYTADGSGFVEPTQILHRISYASGTGKPHIGYSEVIEKVESVSNPNSNGTTSYHFYTDVAGNYKAGVYTYYIGGKETAKQYGVTYELGKPSGNTAYDKNNVTISNSVNSYFDESFYSNKGLYLMTDDSNNEMYPIPTEISPGNWKVVFIPGAITGYIGGQVVLTLPPECNDFLTSSSKADLCNPGIARMTKHTSYAWAKAGGMINTTKSQYFNGNTLQQITNNYYYKDTTMVVIPNKPAILVEGSYLLKATSTTDSKGDVLKKEFLYVDQVNDGTAGTLKSNNILSVPLETKFYKNDVLMSIRKTHYSGTLPSKIQTEKIVSGTSTNLKDRVIFEQFVDGNLVQVKQASGPTTAYIWGYDKRYVIAKIENTTYSAIEALSVFGSGFTISEGLSTAQETALRGMTNVLVSTFTYDPVVGVTSIKDPRGNIINYEYDSFGRLELVKDHNGKILGINEYNYKN